MPPGGDAKSLRDTLLSRKVRWVLWQDGLDLGLSLDASSTVRGQLDSDAQGLRDRKFFRLSHEEKEEHARVYEVL
jgi:hypothetical protein